LRGKTRRGFEIKKGFCLGNIKLAIEHISVSYKQGTETTEALWDVSISVESQAKGKGLDKADAIGLHLIELPK
jgi:hypothetical protein